ncbi:MAG: orotidine-5'-phosphate decarboxylase [Oceanidesulfovibrio sp.]
MSHSTPARERIIFALDVPTSEEAVALVDRLADEIVFFKVGLELFIAAGPPVIYAIADRGGQVMLDLKLHDVPATVRRALLAMKSLPNIAFATVHAEPQVMAAAAEAQAEGGPPVLGVTVLTSLGPEELAASGIARTPQELVEVRAQLARVAGLAGVVCSPRESALVRGIAGPDFAIVTPGVRPAGPVVAGDDQKRVLTPAQAVAAGADHIVIGRPIRDAHDPVAMVRTIVAELE